MKFWHTKGFDTRGLRVFEIWVSKKEGNEILPHQGFWVSNINYSFITMEY